MSFGERFDRGESGDFKDFGWDLFPFIGAAWKQSMQVLLREAKNWVTKVGITGVKARVDFAIK